MLNWKIYWKINRQFESFRRTTSSSSIRLRTKSQNLESEIYAISKPTQFLQWNLCGTRFLEISLTSLHWMSFSLPLLDFLIFSEENYLKHKSGVWDGCWILKHLTVKSITFCLFTCVMKIRGSSNHKWNSECESWCKAVIETWAETKLLCVRKVDWDQNMLVYVSPFLYHQDAYISFFFFRILLLKQQLDLC